MDVPEALLSPFGTVHGGVIATLFDTGLAVAIARRLEPADRIATHNLNVTYVAFTRDRVLRCRATRREPAAHGRGRRGRGDRRRRDARREGARHLRPAPAPGSRTRSARIP